MRSSLTMSHWKSWSGSLMPEGQMSLSESLTISSTGDAAIHCGRLLSQPVVAVSEFMALGAARCDMARFGF